MTTFASANTETWNYNAKGETVRSDHSTNNAFDRSFEFDGIGNRKKSADSLTLPATDNYSSNSLNQYSAVGVDARVHDADGNLTDNGTHLYVWDGENRLIEVQKKSDSSTVATYGYDYKARRITKTVGSTVTNFVYDDWNPIAEFSGTALSKSYVWGMDLSGSMQGAGGVGGLLSVKDGSATYYPTFDGNGNVSEYVDATGTPVAHYEYDAFGQATPSTTNTKSFTHQFSTKQLDAETGFNYYGYRYYDAESGRWLGRDPIEERGGVNLYGFLRNNGINSGDKLGLHPHYPSNWSVSPSLNKGSFWVTNFMKSKNGNKSFWSTTEHYDTYAKVTATFKVTCGDTTLYDPVFEDLPKAWEDVFTGITGAAAHYKEETSASEIEQLTTIGGEPIFPARSGWTFSRNTLNVRWRMKTLASDSMLGQVPFVGPVLDNYSGAYARAEVVYEFRCACHSSLDKPYLFWRKRSFTTNSNGSWNGIDLIIRDPIGDAK
jgi:RHS repeat-associated protein